MQTNNALKKIEIEEKYQTQEEKNSRILKLENDFEQARYLAEDLDDDHDGNAIIGFRNGIIFGLILWAITFKVAAYLIWN